MHCLFGSEKLTKNVYPDKYKYSGYSIGFDSRSPFSFTVASIEKNVIIFGTDRSSSVHVDKKGEDILILGEGSRKGSDDATLTAGAKYPINFTQSGKRYVLSLDYNGSDSFLFAHARKMYQYKAKDS